MIPYKRLITHFQRMNAEHWPYEWGADREGCVDCSGAFVYAYKLEGESIYHGSNRIARKYVAKILPISEARPGMAAFKLRKPGEEYYALPQGYMSGGANYNGDLNDYHHIGLIDEDPAYVLNAKSTKEGFKRSPISEGWDAVAYLNDVLYEEGGGQMTIGIYTVTAESGGTVRMRKLPTTDSDSIAKVPVGTDVEVLEGADGWAKINHNGQNGYMMDRFLVPKVEPEKPVAPDAMVTISLPALVADALLKALENAGWG